MLKREGKPAFTLIELLIVIAVIALLMAILIPSLAMAKERARRVVCSKTVNQFIIGTLIYANEYDNKLPSGQSESGMNGSDEHTPVITRKTGDILVDILGSHAAMKCPWLNEPFDKEDGWYYNGYGYVLGYHYLGGHGGTPWNTPTMTEWEEWKSPQANSDAGGTVLIAELNARSEDGRTFAPHGSRGPINKYHKPGTGGMTPQEAGAAGGNIGLLDGSVSWKKIEAMKFRQGSRQGGCSAVW
jgi:prepilin-type N-terminal cleavage/methylation domain-containing protein